MLPTQLLLENKNEKQTELIKLLKERIESLDLQRPFGTVNIEQHQENVSKKRKIEFLELSIAAIDREVDDRKEPVEKMRMLSQARYNITEQMRKIRSEAVSSIQAEISNLEKVIEAKCLLIKEENKYTLVSTRFNLNCVRYANENCSHNKTPQQLQDFIVEIGSVWGADSKICMTGSSIEVKTEMHRKIKELKSQMEKINLDLEKAKANPCEPAKKETST